MSLSVMEQQLVEAAGQNRTVVIEYRGEEREIEVLKFTEGKHDVLVMSKCRLRGALRSFKLSELKLVRVTNNLFERLEEV